jgi:hypothetical protein
MKKNFPGAFKIGSSNPPTGAQSRKKDIKPMGVDIDGNPVTEGGRRNYNDPPGGVFSMKSPKKAKAKKAASGPGVAVYNDQGQLHAKYMPGDVGYDQAKMMALNTSSAMNMKSPKKMKAKTGAKKDAIMDRKSAMKLKKKSANKLNPGFDKLPKDVQAKIMKKKK